MRPVSDRFKDTITGSHRAVFRCRLTDHTPQFGVNPTGTDIPIISGDVRLEASTDIKATLDIELPGEHHTDLVLGFMNGQELFIERGVDYGDGSTEWVGLGYFRIDDVDQENAPHGSVRVSGTDRASRMIENRTLWEAPATVSSYPSHSLRVCFNRWVNGDPHDTGNASQDGYGMFLFDIVPINWVDLVPDQTYVTGAIVEDSTYEFLQARLSSRGAFTMRFNHRGELDIISTDVTQRPVVYEVAHGKNLVSWSRKVSRDGVANIVTVASSDPEYPSVFFVGYNQSPMFGWTSPFGQVVSRFSSPLLRSHSAAESAAMTRLSKMAYPSLSSSVMTVPNPALEPWDVVEVVDDYGGRSKHWIDSVAIPLSVDTDVTIKTFDVNPIEVVPMPND